MDPLGTALNAGMAQAEMAQAQTQAAMQVSLQKQSLNFQADMAASLINGSLDAGARNALLAQQGIGQNLNVVA
ncbi:MAG: hypothetical protein IJS54_00985 [Desulfovibrio sp.]|nr:hypothetical protein [Desulfovibrio sp.]